MTKENPTCMTIEQELSYIPAVRIFSNPDGTSAFELGKLPTYAHAEIKTFWLSSQIEKWQMGRHVAPRRQYVVTLKGKLKFKVSDGTTFVIKPGIILLAEDLTGEGHSWEMIQGKKWVRLYIPMKDGADNLFVADNL
ncbi:cupin domain-containing protein [Sphingobacterium rhinopitheci]|uniref:hypothetical protein n=1 Tax=Sphingobacterium rhinopitheci TaxID=2781960 RepID=UPI001F525AD1|nr:hypothetical protein [Sphingobacterium rhinopitheci]MCI0921927.1 hypothetical protein [Sphingobacterium rhinopitheci]